MTLTRASGARKDEPFFGVPSPPPAKVLLVDDNPTNLRAFEALLEHPGLEVQSAGSGTEALRHLLTEEFAVIVLDVRMPVMDGLETAAFVRRNRKARFTPILFVSADERTPFDVAEKELTGMIDYCFSPVDGDRLRRKVAGCLEFHRRIVELKETALELTRMNAQKQTRIRRLREINAKLRLQLDSAAHHKPGGRKSGE